MDAPGAQGGGMNIVVYFISLLLILPIAGFAAFGFFIDTLVQKGLWEVIKFVLAPLYDPFGRGLWILFGAAGVTGLCGAGLWEVSRPYGLGVIAALGVLCTIYFIRVYPDALDPRSLFLYLPGVAGVGLSIYSLVRPIR